jgi:hypothetical protein
LTIYFRQPQGRAEERHRGRYNEKTMTLDLNDVLDQFHAWSKSESEVRITTDGKSWVTSLNVVKDSILFDQGAELGSVQTLNLGDAEVFERTDDTIIARWKSGKTVQFQKENPTTLRCQCTGTSCGHHSPEQPCTNEAVPPVAVVLDLATNQPVSSSQPVLCLACHAANKETEGDID